MMPAACIGQTLPRVTDPIFGLSYDPAKVRFEDAGDIVARCPELTNARYGRRLWLFARSTDQSATYVVLGGFFERRDSAQLQLLTDPKGVLLRDRGSECELIGPAREVFDYRADGITPEILHALAGDAATRYAQAFGGRDKFLAVLARNKKKADLANPRSMILREAVQQRAQ